MHAKKYKWLLRLIANPPDHCVEWPWTRNENNYGLVRFEGKQERVHRVVLHLAKGFDLNSSELVMHDCDNKPCCNPKHLDTGNHAANAQDASRKGLLKRPKLITCVRGHDLSGYNLIKRPDGREECRECARLGTQRRRHADLKETALKQQIYRAEKLLVGCEN